MMEVCSHQSRVRGGHQLDATEPHDPSSRVVAMLSQAQPRRITMPCLVGSPSATAGQPGWSGPAFLVRNPQPALAFATRAEARQMPRPRPRPAQRTLNLSFAL